MFKVFDEFFIFIIIIIIIIIFKKKEKNAASTVIFRETVIALVSKVFRTYYILPCPIFSLKNSLIAKYFYVKM